MATESDQSKDSASTRSSSEQEMTSEPIEREYKRRRQILTLPGDKERVSSVVQTYLKGMSLPKEEQLRRLELQLEKNAKGRQLEMQSDIADRPEDKEIQSLTEGSEQNSLPRSR